MKNRVVVLYFKYTDISINIFAFIITIIIFVFSDKLIYETQKVRINMNFINECEKNINEQMQENVITEDKMIRNWKLEIPKIGLYANIVEGTTDEILNKYIGHFSETSKLTGNVALAAHNRGYDVNYFQNLKDLDIGDSVFYTYNLIRKEYKVISKEIIKDTDLSVLDKSNENILTLITCVENMPELRRCVRCIEVKNN